MITAKALAGLGFPSMTYAMRGHDDSEGDLGKLTKSDFLKDTVVAYDYLREQVGDDTKIGVVGSSFGSYIGILLTGLRAVPIAPRAGQLPGQ